MYPFIIILQTQGKFPINIVIWPFWKRSSKGHRSLIGLRLHTLWTNDLYIDCSHLSQNVDYREHPNSDISKVSLQFLKIPLHYSFHRMLCSTSNPSETQVYLFIEIIYIRDSGLSGIKKLWNERQLITLVIHQGKPFCSRWTSLSLQGGRGGCFSRGRGVLLLWGLLSILCIKVWYQTWK